MDHLQSFAAPAALVGDELGLALDDGLVCPRLRAEQLVGLDLDLSDEVESGLEAVGQIEDVFAQRRDRLVPEQGFDLFLDLPTSLCAGPSRSSISISFALTSADSPSTRANWTMSSRRMSIAFS
jgi:hypothetical protein